MNYQSSGRGWTDYRSPLDKRNETARFLRSCRKAEREGASRLFSVWDAIGLIIMAFALLAVIL